MKKNILVFGILLLIISSCNTTDSESKKDSKKEDADNTEQAQEQKSDSIVFDEKLAQELGADNYGMHRYVMAFLKAGPNRSQDSATRADLQRAHMDNITRLANEGVLVMAGPFLDDGELRGIYIFDVDSIEEAKALTETDPAIKAGSLVMELHPWYGSAALKKMNEIHEKVAKINI